MKHLCLLLISLTLFAAPPTITSALSMQEFSKLSALDAAAGDTFGYSVAISGDTAIIGAPGENSSAGAAYIYEYNSDSDTFVQKARFRASDKTAGDQFGYSVAISGDTVVVGAFGDDDSGSQSGSAYLFEKPDSGWKNANENAKLSASDAAASDFFGYSVAISCDTVVVGAFGDGSNSGSAYLFEKPVSGWADANEDAKLGASDTAAGDYFGTSVAISGNAVVVGAIGDSSFSGSAYLFEKPVSGWDDANEDAKLSASDAAANDWFGYSVAISGDTVIVGAYRDDDSGSQSGSAYLFEKPVSGWADANEDAKLGASDAAAGDYFGVSVAISGDRVVVGANGNDDSGSLSGSAYLFEKPVSGWTNATEDAKLGALDAAAYDRFGTSVAISGDRVVVGAFDDDDEGSSSGSAYCFKPALFQNSLENKRDVIAIEAADSDGDAISFSIIGGDDASHFGINAASGLLRFNNAPDYEMPADADSDNLYRLILTVSDAVESSVYRAAVRVSDEAYEGKAPNAISFEELNKLAADTPAEEAHFGISVAISGDTAIIGAFGENDFTGAAYIYEYNSGSDTFVQKARLRASDKMASDRFGRSVAISGDTVVVGADNDDGGTDSGSAYLFEKPASGWTDANEDAKLSASDAAPYDYFGGSVAISGDTVVVGAYGDGSYSGSAYLFEKPASGWTDANEDAKLGALDAAEDDSFGYSVAISGDTVVVGAIGDSSFSGSAYLFEKPASGWTDANEDAKLGASDAAADDQFGRSVAISGDTVVVGAYGDGSFSGSAYLFEKPVSGWADANEDAKLSASDAAADDNFGHSVAISGDTVVVGAFGDDSYSGSAYLFEKPASGWMNANEDAKLGALDAAADQFGYSVAISGDTVLVGADEHDEGGLTNSGASYIFKANGAAGVLPGMMMYLLQ